MLACLFNDCIIIVLQLGSGTRLFQMLLGESFESQKLTNFVVIAIYVCVCTNLRSRGELFDAADKPIASFVYGFEF